MRRSSLLCPVVFLLLSCSGGPEPKAPTTDEPWVADYVAAADSGCECKDSTCLESAKSKLTAAEDAHGGLDEAPFEIHTARGHFMTCYQKGTIDPVRDMTALANSMCACANKACLDRTLIDHLHYRDKYNSKPPTDAQAAELAPLDERFEKCRTDKIITGERLATAFETVAATACSCKGEDRDPCRKRAAEQLPEEAGPFIVVERSTSTDARIETAFGQICRCTLTDSEMTAKLIGGIRFPSRCPEKPKK